MITYTDERGNGFELEVHRGRYPIGSAMYLMLSDKEDDIPYATVSVNMGGDPTNMAQPDPDCFWLKDWSENENIANFLIKGGYIELTGKEYEQGYVVAKEAYMTEKLLNLIDYDLGV